MTTPKKINFDLGIYTFHRILNGGICADDHKVREGQALGVLHPLQNVDPANIYCFAVDRETGQVLQLVRKNLRFRKVIQLTCEVGHDEIELHCKLNASYKYMKSEYQSEQLNIKAA